jgi:aminoglycoside 3-N-acetyltransferase
MGEQFNMEGNVPISYKSIFDEIDEIKPGDILYVVSDVLELSKVAKKNSEKFDIYVFLEMLQKKVGKEGTILLPTFNWDFCKGKMFDYIKTPGKTGALGNKTLHMEEYKRSKHPLYSFAIWGKNKEKLCEMDPINAFGKETIFEFLYKKNAKALVIGLPILAGLTYVHHVETMVRVPYRYDKNFTGEYIDEYGKKSEKTYSMYVRDLEMNALEINGFEPLAKIIGKMGLSKNYNINKVDFHVLNLRVITPIIEKDILENDSRNMYVYKGQKMN